LSEGLSALADLKVVELGVWVAAPAAAALLADWGADVVKVEPPTGDPMRQVFGSLGIGDDLPNPAFALDNRGKRSVVIDLRSDEGRAHMEVIAILDEIIATRTLDEWAERFDAEGAWWAPAQTPAEVVEDPQLLANHGLVEVEGSGRSIRGPVSFSDVEPGPAGPVPGLGQHTGEVLDELRG
jgi:crotonobetainyl-CoA:carnitine CoA-transferase CaiB-like acyl-CoA transferase